MGTRLSPLILPWAKECQARNELFHFCSLAPSNSPQGGGPSPKEACVLLEGVVNNYVTGFGCKYGKSSYAKASADEGKAGSCPDGYTGFLGLLANLVCSK